MYHSEKLLTVEQARATGYQTISNFFLVQGLIVALGKFCISPVILRRKMAIDFYTLTCLTKYHFLVDPFVVTNQANRSRLLGNL